MFWSEDEKCGSWIVTDADLAQYSHILYLDVPAKIISERCRDDTGEYESLHRRLIWQTGRERRRSDFAKTAASTVSCF